MALPTLSKTWEFDVNNVGASSSGTIETDIDNILLSLKNLLIGGSFTVPWTVVSSSNSVTADATDNWAAISDIVHNSPGSAHSWLVLQAPIGDQQLCIDCTGLSQPYQIAWYWSPTAGFTGGTATNRPTATDEATLYADNVTTLPASSFTSKTSVMMSNDGAETRVFMFSAGFCFFCLVASELADPPAGLTDPSFIHISSSSSTSVDQTDRTRLFQGKRAASDGGSFTALQLSCEAIQVNTTDFDDFMGQLTVPNDWAGEWHMGPVGVWGTGGVQRGKIGNIPDLFWGQTTVNTGDQYPASGILYQFSQIGDLIIPWDSTTVIQTS